MAFIVALPATFRVAGARFTRRVARSASESPFSYQRQVTIWPGRQWIATLPLTVHRPAEADAIDAFLQQLTSEENTVQFSGATFGRPYGPETTLSWRLSPQTEPSLPRSAGGFSDPYTLTFYEAIDA